MPTVTSGRYKVEIFSVLTIFGCEDFLMGGYWSWYGNNTDWEVERWRRNTQFRILKSSAYL